MKTQILIASLLLATAGCQDEPAAKPQPQPEPEPRPQVSQLKSEPVEKVMQQAHEKQAQMSGTVKYIALEGGFFGIIGADGQQLLPSNLPQEMQKNGLVISFGMRPDNETMGIQQWGTRVVLSNPKVVDDRGVSDPSH
ncbi:hypothetical protein [Paraferrimonas sedimenticola]|uniref:Uncharacterized protein n=1 Tax=Paraferrimonas sedimenticola TaxID=375674 RepID=A0AA37RZB8_9GAMM|nr:hypothetical protein [Paraferrimonas sedimenticola]GLP98136.1 hypothetical protein GCM10007895_34430 [Paraferrimonas sedimenticola]